MTPNEVAKRAAENPPPVAATALAAGAQEQQQQGQVDEVQITEQNARRSDQDFENAIIQGLNGDQQREEQRREARSDDDDDDDNLKDIGKLLLAGAAGFAVGKMLSNDRQVALNTGDRVVVTLPDGSQQVIKDDNALLYQPGSNVRTETFDDGSTRTTVLREDGSRVVTIRDANMNILRRTLVRADGSETRLIDDTAAEPVRISTLPAPPPVEVSRGPLDEAALREALRREASVDRRFTLGQIRDIPEVRALVAPVNVPEITFETGSSAITPDQAQQLATLGKVIRDSVDQNPAEIYMIEGYTDAVGSDAANLALSDRRAESVALALTEYFQVPPENMVVQGYGEQFLLVPSDGPERDNRRVAVRRITDLMEQN
ncbi:OmpA family protein [Paracoccus sp. N5]|uniref:OmpA family protein n=1 Tax=Paracoccus sp. N5 TaxID=1101189 RepID=UPI001E305579|nr:OmpA family protein [Paracoccus sp. N5]